MNRRKGPYTLRVFVILLGVLMISLAAWSHAKHADVASIAILVTYGLTFIVGTLFEQWRYKSAASSRGQGWKQTDEVFLDPVTGVKVRVWFNPITGERDYRPVDD